MKNEENEQPQTTDQLNEDQANVESTQNTEELFEDQESELIDEFDDKEYDKSEYEEDDEKNANRVLSKKELKKKKKAAFKLSHRKLKSAYALKRGAYTTAITAVFIAGVIIFNVLATALADRFPLQIDLTTDSSNSISDENAEYLRNITRDVKVIVCCTEDEYSGDYFTSYASETYKAQDSTGKYFKQTADLINQYPKFNNKISVEFADTTTPDFSDTLSKYSDSSSIGLGDILVESTFDVNGVPTTRTKVVSFSDTYTLSDESGYAAYGYGTYTVSGSKLETALTSAIYSVTSDKTTMLGIPTMYCNASAISDLTTTLKSNNYEIEEISTLTLSSIPSELDGIIIAAPSSDFSDAELEVLDSFLNNDGKKGKTLLYFPSTINKELPNLEEFLSEWGINYLDGTLYETNENNHMPDESTNIGLTNKQTDYTASVNDAKSIYICGNNAPMSVAFESFKNRSTSVLMSSSDTTVIKPSDSGTDWTPSSSDTKQSYPTALLCAETSYDDDNNKLTSCVVAFSSVDFIGSTWTQYSSVGNLDLSVALINAINGRDASDISFVDKSITNQSFSDKISKASSTFIMIIFVFIFPITLIVVGITVWVRRKNR